MADQLEVLRITITPADFIECSNSSPELRTRTSLVSHLDLNALTFVPYETNSGLRLTLFFPAYYAADFFGKVGIKELINNLALEPNEGALFGVSGTYLNQASLGVFPRDVETTRRLLNRWLDSNRNWLKDKPSLKNQIYKHISKQLRNMVEGNVAQDQLDYS